MTAHNLKDGSNVTLKSIDSTNKLQQWKFTKEETFIIDTKEHLSLCLLPIISTPALKSSEKQKWKVNNDGYLQHQKSILYLSVQKDNIKEDSTLIGKKLSSKLSQMWLFIPIDKFTKVFIEHKISQAKLYKVGTRYTLRIEINNKSKKMFCQPRLVLDNSKYDKVPFFIKSKDEKEFDEKTEEIIIHSSESSFSGFLTYSIFDEGVNDYQLIGFQVKDKRCNYHLDMIKEKDLPQDKQLLKDCLSKFSVMSCINVLRKILEEKRVYYSLILVIMMVLSIKYQFYKLREP